MRHLQLVLVVILQIACAVAIYLYTFGTDLPFEWVGDLL